MPNTSTSTYMSLPVPVVGVDPGPQWATDINACLTLVDQHDHSSGSGVAITPAGLNINVNLPFQNNNATGVRSVRLQSQGSPFYQPADINCVYSVGPDLYYGDASGNQIQITQGGSVAGTPGSIANLVSPASASYVSGNQTFVWQSAASTPANMDGGAVILRNITASSKGLTLSPPNAMGADYSIVLPTLPSLTSFVTIDSSGNIGTDSNNLNGEHSIGNSGAGTVTVNLTLNALNNITITGACTFAFSNPLTGMAYVLRCIGNGTVYTVTWPNTVFWSNGIAPILTGTSGYVDLINFYYDGTNYYGSYALNFAV